MDENLIKYIEDSSNPARDLRIDDLNDLLEAGAIEYSDEESIIFRIIQLLRLESDKSVIESIFNLLGSAHSRGSQVAQIEDVTLQLLKKLEAGALAHAIDIIGSSSRLDKYSILRVFLDSENRFISQLARDALNPDT